MRHAAGMFLPHHSTAATRTARHLMHGLASGSGRRVRTQRPRPDPGPHAAAVTMASPERAVLAPVLAAQTGRTRGLPEG